MKHPLACCAVLCALLAGCTTESKPPPPMVYKDSRSVTTRPAPANGRNADVLVRLRELQVAGGTMISTGDAPPADAKEIASTELLATYGTPFYCTLGLPNERLELGGIVTHQGNGTCRVHIDSMHHIPGGGIGVNTTQEMPLGQTRTLMGGLQGAGSHVITLVLEPLPK